jgi:3-deoxy-manno-octulosonate cytidylyltransferase (CMP-KDO synthetase)
MKKLIVIPARIASTRLPGKMLADIGGKPLIVRTYENAVIANAGDVIVACDGKEIADAITKAGGPAILTDPNLPSGTDRVFAAWVQYDKNQQYQFIVNVQGDMPFVDPKLVRAATEVVEKSGYDISTLATQIKDGSYLLDSVVKPIISFADENNGKALYFSRSPVPYGGPYFHHVGIYCFRADALRKYVNLPQSYLEKLEKLEQLRALENDMTIGITVINTDAPINVDTPEDLEKARRFFQCCK